jgi:probable rRNA maturation factor
MARRIRVQQGPALRRRRRPAAEPPISTAYPLIRTAARVALVHVGRARAELSITLLADGEIAALNARYLGHDRPTDVLAFSLYERGEDPVGDVYIGYEQALRQAASLGIPLREELARLAVHGTLHVLGYDHPEGEQRMQSAMWRMQEAIVALLPLD